LALVDLVPQAGLPAARVGIAAGPVVWRDGDTYGRTVNVASRILGVAQPGEVLVTKEATDSILDIDPEFGGFVRFDDIGTHRFKGVTDPVRLFRVRRDVR
jgi:adenylate cyclase